MNEPRVGIWLIGAWGGVGTTVAIGLAALRQGLADSTGLATGLPQFAGLPLAPANAFVVGGHDVRQTSFEQTCREFQRRANVLPPEIVDPCSAMLREWDANVCPGTVQNAGEAIASLSDRPDVRQADTGWGVIDLIQADYQAFQARHRLDQMVVVNVASTEPPFELTHVHDDVVELRTALAQRAATPVLPASGLYALAAVDLGIPYVNFTPSLGASFPAAIALAEERGTVVAGQDGKTGETLLKTVLAPMFAHRNLRVLSWVGHNIFGNRDGQILNDPRNKESKVRTKDQVVASILGYKPQTLVSIEYVESLDDWKTAWDHVHFHGFLGTKMAMQFTWQGCDSLLAAPLVIDLARLALHAHRRGEVGILKHLACFFKNPMGVGEHDFFRQWDMLTEYVKGLGKT